MQNGVYVGFDIDTKMGLTIPLTLKFDFKIIFWGQQAMFFFLGGGGGISRQMIKKNISRNHV